MSPRISLCLIVKNEAATLATCLQSAADLVDEIIVVDTGSTDSTKEVAAQCGARVFDFPWVDSFAAARNESLRHATGDWIFWLDGDEYLDADNRVHFRALCDRLGDDLAGFSMKQRSAPENHRGSATAVDQVRLFRNHPALRWSYRVHEQILPALRQAGDAVRFTHVHIEHTGYVDPALRDQKTRRNLRLLLLDHTEHPDDAFILFNLGWTYQELGETARAMPYLRKSLERSQPGDSIVRKLFALLAHGHRTLGQPREALAVCRAGRVRCADDAELLFLEGLLLEGQGDPAGASAVFEHLLNVRPGAHFASLDPELRGPRTRHHLALAYRAQGRLDEAEEQWRTALAERPDLALAWLELADLYLAQNQWAKLEQALGQVEDEPSLAGDVGLLRGRACLARGEFTACRQLLEEVIAQQPQAVKPRQYLTYCLLQENRDLAAAERALRALVELEPRDVEGWRNLALLLRGQGRLAEAEAVCQSGEGHCAGDRRWLLVHGLVRFDAGNLAGAEALLLRFLESQPLSNGHDEFIRGSLNTARRHLASIYHQARRPGEAEAQWRAALADQPEFLPGWVGLGEVCLEQQRWDELEEIAGRLEGKPEGRLEAAVLRARGHLGQRDYGAALALLEPAIADHPRALWPRVIRSRALLQEGRDEAAAEQALREVLTLAPSYPEARHNLAVLLGKPGNRRTACQAVAGSGRIDNPSSESNGQADHLPHGGNGSAVPAIARKCLRVAFASYNPLDFAIDTVYQRPLGGSESALCYLAEALAGAGHDVFLLNAAGVSQVSRGVHCLPLRTATFGQLPPLDAFVVQNMAGEGRALRPLVGPRTCLVLWTQHAHDQPAVRPLFDPAERRAYDGFALVSDWQRDHFMRQFDLEPERTAVLRNAIAPAFMGLFPDDTPILEQKSRPPVLAYTSTPYRGLDVLLEAFPRIRQAVPGTVLKVFSSTTLYGIAADEDRTRFGALYQRCRETAGVEYVGSVPQPELAHQLRVASVLAYPNTFEETSCIAVLEAMAAGCGIVTSALGALPETTAGFARLVSLEGGKAAYLDRFVEATVEVLTGLTGSEVGVEGQLRRQVTHLNQHGAWSTWAENWRQWLSGLRVRGG